MKDVKRKKALDYVCGTIATVTFLLMLGVTGNCENRVITVAQYVMQLIPLLIVFTLSIRRFMYK